MPVFQGWTLPEYLRHVDAYTEAGVTLTGLPLVGVGNLCRRQGSAAAAVILGTLARR